MNKSIRLTVGQALVRYLAAQHVERDGRQSRFIEGIWGIFGHGNVSGLDRLPVLLLPSDYFANRVPDPVLQQIEHPLERDVSANDAFRPVSRFLIASADPSSYWQVYRKRFES